jgi:hypothetical protein
MMLTLVVSKERWRRRPGAEARGGEQGSDPPPMVRPPQISAGITLSFLPMTVDNHVNSFKS